MVTAHAGVFRDLVENQCQFRPFQHDLTGLIVLPHKSLAKIVRGLLESADNTNRSRLLSEAPWREAAVNRRRIRFTLQQTPPHRRRRRASRVVLDDTRCEQVGSLLDEVDRPAHHRDGTSPLAHNLVTSVDVRGAVRVPLGRRLYRRDAERTQWEATRAQHVPDLPRPREKKARHRRHPQVAPVWLQAPDGRARPEPFRTKIALAIDLVEEAIRGKVPFGVVGFDAWYLAEDVVRGLTRRRQDGSSRLTQHRGLETARVQLRDVIGWALKRPGPHLALEDVVPLIPATASRPVPVGAQTDWCVTRGVRIAGLGKVRGVVSGEDEALTGRSAGLVTNRVDWSAAKSIGRYRPRWPTAPFDPDRKGHLGVTAYRLRRIEALGNHGGVGFVASARRHVRGLPTGPDRTKGLMPTLGDACRQQGRALLQRLLGFGHDQVSHGATMEPLLTQLFAKQRGMVPG